MRYRQLAQMKPGMEFYISLTPDQRHENWVEAMEELKGTRMKIDYVWINYTTYADEWVIEDCFVDWERTNALYDSQTASYTEAIIAVMARQCDKGLRKYGSLLENGPVNLVESVDHCIEEIVDTLYYLQHMKTLIQKEMSK